MRKKKATRTAVKDTEKSGSNVSRFNYRLDAYPPQCTEIRNRISFFFGAKGLPSISYLDWCPYNG